MTWYIGVLLISMDIVAKRSRQLLFWSEDKLVINDLFLISNFILKSQFRDSLRRFNLVWCWKLCLLQSLAAWFTVYWQWETEDCQKLYATPNKNQNCTMKYIKDQRSKNYFVRAIIKSDKIKWLFFSNTHAYDSRS